MFSQKKMVKAAISALEAGDLDLAESSINEAIKSKDPKVLNWVNTWYTKGKVYQGIYEDPDLSNNPKIELERSSEAYKKALELINKEMAGKSKEHEYKGDVVARMKAIESYFGKEAEKCRLKGYFKKEIEFLNYSIDLAKTKELGINENQTLLFAGTAHRKLNNYAKAGSFLDKVIAAKFGKAQPYYQKALIMKAQTQFDEMQQLLKTGIETYPDDSGLLLNDLCKYLTDTGKGKEAQLYLEQLDTKFISNADILASLGFVYEKNGLETKALEHCKKALNIAPNSFTPNYYMGLLYCNKAIGFIAKEDAKVKDVRTVLRKEVPTATTQFKLAKPYLEKAHNLTPSDEQTLVKLQMVYRKLNMWNELIETKKKQERL